MDEEAIVSRALLATHALKRILQKKSAKMATSKIDAKMADFTLMHSTTKSERARESARAHTHTTTTTHKHTKHTHTFKYHNCTLTYTHIHELGQPQPSTIHRTADTCGAVEGLRAQRNTLAARNNT